MVFVIEVVYIVVVKVDLGIRFILLFVVLIVCNGMYYLVGVYIDDV